MPIMIQFHDDLSCPTVICDWCQQPITDARLGGYFFPPTDRAVSAHRLRASSPAASPARSMRRAPAARASISRIVLAL